MIRRYRIRKWLHDSYHAGYAQRRYEVSLVFKSRTARAAFKAALKNKTRVIPKHPTGGATVSEKMLRAWRWRGWVQQMPNGRDALTVTGVNMFLFWQSEFQ